MVEKTEIKRNYLVNPFETNSVVEGEKFIGRNDYIKNLTPIIKFGQSIYLRGLPRVGKTSLAIRLLDEVKSIDSDKEKYIIISIYLGDCESFYHMWRNIVNEIEDALVNYDNELRGLFESIINAGDNYESVTRGIKKLFKYLCERNIRVLIRIDEFDSVTSVFKDNTGKSKTYFQFLRVLMTEPKYTITFIIVARRSPEQLEARADGGSTWSGAIRVETVRCFDDIELNEFRTYAEKNGIMLTEDDWSLVITHAGRSPFMLSKTMQELLEESGSISVRDTLTNIETKHYPYFDRLIELMSEDGGEDMNALIQIFVGPKYNLSQYRVNELVQAGYVWVRDIDKKYESLSDVFQQYFCDKVRREREVDVWPKMTDVEKRLRDIIEKHLKAAEGENWEDSLIREAEESASKGNRYIDLSKINFYKDPRNRAKRLVDTLSFVELSKIIRTHWDEMKTSINLMSKKEFADACFILKEARNPYAHANSDLLSDIEIMEADLECERLLKAII